MAWNSTKTLASLQQEAGAEGAGTLKRVLSATNLTMLGIGAIIGAGIFVLTGVAAAQLRRAGRRPLRSPRGRRLLLRRSLLRRVRGDVPIAGSAYTYAYATLGEFVAWIIGWDLILEYAVRRGHRRGGLVGLLRQRSCATPSASPCPRRWTQAPLDVVRYAHAGAASGRDHQSPRAVVHRAPDDVLLVVGIQESASLQHHHRVREGDGRAPRLRLRAHLVNPANWHPFVPPNTGEFGHFGWSGVLARRGGGLLRLHWLRRGIHRGAGSEETAARHAHRHPGLARDLHRALHPRGARADRARSVHQLNVPTP